MGEKILSMCGIAGILGNTVQPKDSLLNKMLASIQHRGPDSTGLWQGDNIAFGMQRLSIVDLPGGNQPIWAENGVGIVFNGEIYNYKEIRSQLKNSGAKFQTQSDTEVILQQYIHKGIQGIHELNGMFAIFIYDPTIKKAFLIRDRLGIKPLYYFSDQNAFYFSSEIKSIIQALDKKPGINLQSIWDFLTLRYVPGPNTIWNNLSKLMPGHYLEYDLDKHSFVIHSYWKISFESDTDNQGRNYLQEFEDLFLASIERRLLASDVPVGILLSGGLDSSSIAAASVELGHKNFHTFSIGFEDGEQFNELKYANLLAKHLQSDHHEIVIGKTQFLDYIEDFVWYSDEPLGDLASIPLNFVSKLASEHVKVVLSGEGSDEILGGYNLDKTAHFLSYLKMFDKLPRWILERLPLSSLKNLSHTNYNDFFRKYPPHITNIFNDTDKKQLCQFGPFRSTDDYLKDLYQSTKSSEPLDQLQTVYCSSWLVEDLLMKADKFSMANSLELRVPFLDHTLVEWACKLPLSEKFGKNRSQFTTKKILRDFSKNRIPDEILNRPKQGFPVPAYQWLTGDTSKLISDCFQNPVFLEYFSYEALSPTLIAAQKGDINAAHKTWNLLILSLWMKKWLN